MIKLILAIVIALVLVTGGICLEICIDNTFTELTKKIDDIMLYSPEAEYDLNAVISLEEWWEKQHSYLEIFVPHTFLNEMDIVLGELKGSIAAEDYPTSTALLNRLYETSTAMKSMFKLKVGNIL